MTADLPVHDMDAHARPPDALKAFYKKYQKLKGEALDIDQEVLNLDTHKARDGVNLIKEVDYHQGSDDRNACQLIADFLASRNDVIEVFELESIPGKSLQCLDDKIHILTCIQAFRSSQICCHHLRNLLCSINYCIATSLDRSI